MLSFHKEGWPASRTTVRPFVGITLIIREIKRQSLFSITKRLLAYSSCIEQKILVCGNKSLCHKPVILMARMTSVLSSPKPTSVMNRVVHTARYNRFQCGDSEVAERSLNFI